ncbi:MAG: FG-GAP repeat domain-containing protein [Acidobacteriota bacterium]
MLVLVLAATWGLVSSGCRHPEPRGMVLAMGLAVFTTAPDGRQVPGAATAAFLAPAPGEWKYGTLADPNSNVFHKALAYCPRSDRCGLLTLGGTAAALTLWRPDGQRRVLWQTEFGGRFSRLRDAEVADVLGDGVPTVVVGTHDQGVVALVRPDGTGGFTAREIDRQSATFVHEIEVGDLDGDRVLEIYATVSLPNRLDGTPQPGSILRYTPARTAGRAVFADLGDRHAKEILVTDVDGDGRDELIASVEAVSGGSVEIRRYDPSGAGETVAVLPDRLCRCLTAGDVDSDGRREVVAATAKSGLWLLRPEPEGAPWRTERIDAASSGFEHPALLADLDGDGRDELYVASDDQHEIRRYVWSEGTWRKDALYRYEGGMPGFTWALTAVDAAVVPASVWE